MAYTIVLVDDEDEVRGRIASKILGSNEFEVIGSASNGYDALDLLEEIAPDVVITDIKMPFVDGIELTRIISKRYPTIKVGIISGYDDYNYLKEAINLDVVAYLSKPITNKHVAEFLGKIKETLDTENEHVRLKEDMMLNQVRSRILNQCLHNYQLSEEDGRTIKEVGFDYEDFFVIVSTRMINYPSGIIEREKKKNQCFLMMEELMGECFSAYHILHGQDIVSIVKVNKGDFDKKLDILLYKVVNYFQKYLMIDIAIGVSGSQKFRQIAALYRQSQFVLDEFGLTDKNPISYYGESDQVKETKTLSVEALNECKKNMRYMDQADFTSYINELTQTIKEDANYDYFNVLIALSGLLIEYANAVGASLKIPLDINTIKTYIESRNIEGFMSLLMKHTFEIKNSVISRKTKKTVKVLSDIIAYLEQNYNNPDMSMDVVADKFKISVSYLSTLFKRETETTFNKYLVTRRIEHAKFLLKNTDDKMVVIAEKCGYKDVYYFSHSFKKTAGMSPKEFKKNEIH